MKFEIHTECMNSGGFHVKYQMSQGPMVLFLLQKYKFNMTFYFDCPDILLRQLGFQAIIILSLS